ncbi:MAG: ComEC/Rec2 family competence protein, partial [Dehalococcoidia bacterium]|nr:ComEC/Rec2 family competence protein [Dehalococcoidia bacterium]
MPLLYVSVAWIAGIFAGSIFTAPVWLLALPLLFIPLIILMPGHRRPLALLAVCVLAFPAGALLYQSSQHPLNSMQVQYYNDQGAVSLEGVVDDQPEVRGSSLEFKLAASNIHIADNSTSIRGGVLIRLPFFRSYQYGDMLQLSGRLETPPQFEDFDYRDYLANKGIYSIMNYPAVNIIGTDKGYLPLAWIYSLRNNLSQSLTLCLPEPQGSLARAILLGLRGSLPYDLLQSFYATGTTHLIAISGMNLTILLGMVLALTIWIFGRKNRAYFWISLSFIWLYTLLTGMPATMVRAAVMGSVFLLAELLGRQRNGLAALVLAAALMTAAEPRVLWDISFQMSFLSMLGLILIAPYLIAFASPHMPHRQSRYTVWLKKIIVISFATTLAAVIATWPLTALSFHSFSIVSAPATFFSMPSFPGIIITSLFTALADLAWPPLGTIFGWLAWLFLSYFLLVVQIFSSIPVAYIREIELQPWQAIACYIVLGLILACFRYRQHVWTSIKSCADKARQAAGTLKSINLKPVVYPALAVLLAGNILVWTAVSLLPDGKLHVSVLDVGQGECILIRTPRGQNILIDTGPDPTSAYIQLGKKLPLWDKQIDMLILTQLQSDHIAGTLELLKRYHVRCLGLPPSTSKAVLPGEIVKIATDRRATLHTMVYGKQLNTCDGVRLTVLNPQIEPFKGTEDDVNNNSVVIRLSYGGVSFLLCADIGMEAEQYLAGKRADLQSDILKVAHHGSK